ITTGIKEDILKEICENPFSVQSPVQIAEGIPPKNGTDAYLVNEVKSEEIPKREKFNFRNVMTIPSVKSGTIIATIIPPTPGSPGIDVYGNQIPAFNGKSLKVRPGKNVILNGNQFFALTDGQISLTNSMISINPVFEV